MTVSLIGVGAMGGALLSGWLASGNRADDVTVVVRRDEQARALHVEHGVRSVTLDEAAAADVVVVAVKPAQFESLLADLRPAEGSVVVSVAAGVTVEQLEAWLPEGTAVARAMPNTGALAGESMTGIVRGSHTTDEQLDSVVRLFEAVGRTLVVPESQLDAVIAVSGSGIAYLYYVADAMIEAGVHQGLTRAQSRELVAQTFAGASAVLSTSGRSAADLRADVTSPAGTTAAALRKLDDHGVRAAFLDAVEACRQRAAQMGKRS